MATCNFCGKEIMDGFIFDGDGMHLCEGSTEDGNLGECAIQQMIKDGETEESARAIFKANQLIMDDNFDSDFDSEDMASLTPLEREKIEELEVEWIFYTTFDDVDVEEEYEEIYKGVHNE